MRSKHHRWLLALVVLGSLLAPHDGTAGDGTPSEPTSSPEPLGQTIYVGEQFHHTTWAEIDADGRLEIGCGAEDSR